jgi:alpha-galactosidase
MTGNRDLVVEAMLADGGVTDDAVASALTADLLAAQARYLPRFG